MEKTREVKNMTIKDITEILAWLKKNGGRKISQEEKERAVQIIGESDTVNQLVSAVYKFVKELMNKKV